MISCLHDDLAVVVGGDEHLVWVVVTVHGQNTGRNAGGDGEHPTRFQRLQHSEPPKCFCDLVRCQMWRLRITNIAAMWQPSCGGSLQICFELATGAGSNPPHESAHQ